MDIYVVQPGDTIDHIANLFGVSVDKLIIDNELEEPNQLIPGHTIVIAYPSETYTVQEGDSLGSIAALFNITVSELLRNNPILSGMEFIYPGQVLTIAYNRTARIATYGYTNPFIDRQILRKTLPYLTYLSIFNYVIGEDGDTFGSDDDIEVIQLAQEYGVIPLMHLATITVQGEQFIELTNKVISDEELQNRLFENVIDIIKEKGYYGIIISAQHITSENQNLFYNYTRRFFDRLQREGFLTFIAIDPAVENINNQIIYEDIDYSSFSEIVESIILLEYTWGTIKTLPAPIISVYNLNVFLGYIQTQIEADKIAIGIPALGYVWELPYVSGTSRSNFLTLDNVMSLAREVGATIQFDEVSQNPYYIFENEDSSNQSIVWFVDARTIDSVLDLLLERGISQIGVWNIMTYFAQLWLVLNSQYEIIKLLPEF